MFDFLKEKVEPTIPCLRLEFVNRYTSNNDGNVKVKFICKLHFDRLNFSNGDKRVSPSLFKSYNKVHKPFKICDDGRFEVTAQANCNDCDNFDLHKGFILAETRAKAKAYNIAMEISEELLKDFEKTAQTMRNSVKRFDKLVDLETKHIKELRNA